MTIPLLYLSSIQPQQNFMHKISIVGCSGAGKSTLARQLGTLLGLPVFHLDAEMWKPSWVMSSDAEEQIILQRLLAEKTWIIDGNYGGTMPQRFEAADTIIFLDFSRRLCLWRVFKRWWRYKGSVRPDMADDCPEQLDIPFLQWIWHFSRTNRPGILEAICSHTKNCEVIILCNPREVRHFLQSLKQHKL